jgi:hypothetical protein
LEEEKKKEGQRDTKLQRKSKNIKNTKEKSLTLEDRGLLFTPSKGLFDP